MAVATPASAWRALALIVVVALLGHAKSAVAETPGGAIADMAAKVVVSLRSVSESVQAASAQSTSVPASGVVEVAFSPDGGALGLVIKAIDSVRPGESLDMMAYSFTSAPVTSALIRAHKRGVRTRLVADHNHNVGDAGRSSSRKARAALSALANAGIEVRTTSAFAIHHDKVAIGPSFVQTGSFNYSDAAQTRNSENVIVVWNNEQLVKAYRRHFTRNFSSGKPYSPSY